MEMLILLFVLSLAVSAGSLTLTKAKISATFRERVAARSKFFGELLECPYCTSHWLGFFAVVIYQPRFGAWLLVDIVLATFAVVALASFWSYIIMKAFDFNVHKTEESKPDRDERPVKKYGAS